MHEPPARDPDLSPAPSSIEDRPKELSSERPTDAAPGITPQAVYGEVRSFIRSHDRRRRQIPRAVLVGILAGAVGAAFRRSLLWGDDVRDALIRFGQLHPAWGFWLPVLFGAIGAAVALWLVRSFAPEAAGSGIPHVKAVLHRQRGMLWQRILPVKFIGGITGIGGGLALGREGPTVQMGAAVGQMVSRWLNTTTRERRTLIAAGAGAGLAAAFNAPLAGVIFVLEEVQRDFAPGVLTAAFIASVSADIVVRLLMGQLPVFHVPELSIPPLASLPGYLALGLTAGIFGVLFNRTLVGSLNLFQCVRRWPSWAVGGLVGAAVGLVGWYAPSTVGGGHRLVERTLSGQEPLAALPLLFALRFVLTMVSYGSGAPGGIFAPLLVLGAQLGLGVGKLYARLLPWTGAQPSAFAVVGMAAYFTAIVRAPLTGIVLIIEMTGNYFLMLPLLVACLTAYGLADFLGDRPVYEALLERDLLRGQDNAELEDTLLLDLPVYAGSAFEGKSLRELHLPPGCLILSIQRGLKDEVPTADTRLEAGDRLTAVVAPRAAAAVPLLHEGTEPARR